MTFGIDGAINFTISMCGVLLPLLLEKAPRRLLIFSTFGSSAYSRAAVIKNSLIKNVFKQNIATRIFIQKESNLNQNFYCCKILCKKVFVVFWSVNVCSRSL